MKIIVFGATGDVGSRIVKEALSQGHSVTAVVRNASKLGTLPDQAKGVVADVTDRQAIEVALTGHDLAVSALRPPSGQEGKLVALTRSVLEAASASRIPVIVSGGAARLKLPGGNPHTVLSDPDFLPEEVVPIARASLAQAELCASMSDLDWTYATPSALLNPGERHGQYRLGTDTLIVDGDGNSSISMEDFAAAIVAEASARQYRGKAFTVGY